MKTKILIVDDEEGLAYIFKTWLTSEGHEILTAKDYFSALQIISEENLSLIFVDILLGEHSGIELLKTIKESGLLCPVVMITGQPDIETAAKAVRLGAFDYLIKPIHKEPLLRSTKMALEHMALTIENERYRNNLDAIFRSVTEAIITVDKEKRVTESNDAVEKVFGIPAHNLTGRLVDEIFHPSMNSCQEILHQTLENQKIIREYRLECHQTRKVLIVNCSPLVDRNNESLGAVLVARDVTRIRDLECELQERYSYQNIIGKSKEMQNIYSLIENLVDIQTTVLITGDSGTGKELIAKALHYGGCRSARPLVTVNCSALSENILESELFGHVKGAFTGAVADKKGRFQMANGGSIFLDEIGDISLKVQAKLLRVLQEKEFERVGDSVTIKVDVRLIAATNRKLEEEVKKGNFREDLYYRLKVVEIVLPPLRKRTEDIPLLIDNFCQRYNKSLKKRIHGVTDEVLSMFMRYPWPGNIRELEHAIEHAVVLCKDTTISPKHIPLAISGYSGNVPEINKKDKLYERKDELFHVLESTGWNKAKAARKLGISRKTMYRKISKYNIDEPAE